MSNDLSRESCEKAVRNYLNSSDFVLKDYKVRPVSEKNVGFMGRHLKLTADVVHDGNLRQISFFVKMLPTGRNHRFIVVDCNLFGTEATVYNKYVPKFNSCLPPGKTFPVPKCYFTGGPDVDPCKWTDSGNEEVMILEDLTIRGYRCRENCPPMDLPHCHAVLRAMASYHASSILLEDSCRKAKPGDFDPKRDLYSEITENFLIDQKGHMGYECIRLSAESMATAVFKLWPEKFRGVSRDTVLEALMGGWNMVFEMVKTSTEFPNVICHGDPWTNNIMFSYGKDEDGREIPVDALFVDLQIARYAPPVLDILIFMHACTRKDFRDRHLKDLLKFYHDALTEIVPEDLLDEVLPFQLFMKMCDRFQDFGRVLSTAYLPIILSENDPSITDGDNPREPLDIDRAVYCDRGDRIASNCIKSKSYRGWIIDSFKDCLELLNLWT